MKPWKRTEPRILRPFFGAESLRGSLQSATVTLKSGEEPIVQESITLEPSDWGELALEISTNIDDEMLKSVLGERASNYVLLLTLRDPMLRRRVKHMTWNCEDPLPPSIKIDSTEIHKLSHDRSIEITLSLCLTADCKPEAGWPSVMGSWLSRKKFSLGLPKQIASFDILPLTDDLRQKNGLPSGTLVFADLAGGINDPLEEGASFATVYVAEGVLAAMNSGRSSHELTAIMEAEMITALISTTASEIQELDSVNDNSPLASLLGQLGDKDPMPIESFKELMKHPQKIRAQIHDEIDLISHLRKL